MGKCRGNARLAVVAHRKSGRRTGQKLTAV